jgi:hypothetical protein
MPEQDKGETLFIDDEIVRKKVGDDYADAVRWFRTGLKSQGTYLRRCRDVAFWWARWSQILIVVLGFVASLAAIFSHKESPDLWPGQDTWSIINIIVPLIISSASGLLALFDFRAVFARNSAAFSIIACIKSEVDYSVLLSKPSAPAITPAKIDEWNRRAGAAMLEHATEWERMVTQKQTVRPPDPPADQSLAGQPPHGAGTHDDRQPTARPTSPP